MALPPGLEDFSIYLAPVSQTQEVYSELSLKKLYGLVHKPSRPHNACELDKNVYIGVILSHSLPSSVGGYIQRGQVEIRMGMGEGSLQPF
jgi:hypothetical protein